MAGLFVPGRHTQCRLLDAGAGLGTLCAAFQERVEALNISNLHIEAFEQDESVWGELLAALSSAADRHNTRFEVIGGDFIEHALNRIQFGEGLPFTHAILNPPYKKIAGDSRHRLLLRQAGIETVNLYSAFVALALDLLVPGGQLVAIVPRSFCNGPYYRPFRERILSRSAIRRIHLFDSRDSAFKDDAVLQENVIVVLERGARQGEVVISTSTDDSFSDLALHDHPFERIVFPDDAERFIHVPKSPQRGVLEDLAGARCALPDIGVQVSTGPVVDFRLKRHLRNDPDVGTVPLLYPGHFSQHGVQWPKADFRKANAIVVDEESEKWLFPIGFYCVVKRFSSKEEVRRIVAHTVSPTSFPGMLALGFENHLNVFHAGKRGLDEAIARGLTVYLNSSAVDESFRRFNGHTQVNATDLKLMKYPSQATLAKLGAWATALRRDPSQQEIDSHLLLTLR